MDLSGALSTPSAWPTKIHECRVREALVQQDKIGYGRGVLIANESNHLLNRTIMTDVVRSVTAPLMIGAAITTYFATFPKDRTIYRLIVGTLIVLDVVQTVFSQLTLWRWFIQAPQDTILGKTGIPWPFAFSPMLCGLTTAVVQTFYAYRMIIPLVIIFGALVQLSWSTYATTQIIKIREFSKFHIHLRSIISVFWLGTAALTDCFLTGNLIYWLSNSKTQIHQTNSLLNDLIMLAIETNGLTFAVAALDLVLFACRSDSAHLAPNLCLGKLYSISLLISLNTRCRLGKNFGGQRSVLLDCMAAKAIDRYRLDSAEKPE
ncbi:uncharacterized protein MELLADRAFT_105610 [Melampsora larici-populina 98AG31]|uniref:DUF6534 domain-containing protein n=1 Tax=Melampsora larici-populina (strain 98AG31 / pathotype 3-4-7) TaxID=747676 RepID=F4RIS8_MELLP|nr:uncharacterized protein MELLADRAFT_105610 [Melampsora larici-populina 98AG31]EGG07778.1 hypothetical protein MELLADRAFT_105610 [Melampsora larici-populina 98AG31]